MILTHFCSVPQEDKVVIGYCLAGLFHQMKSHQHTGGLQVILIDFVKVIHSIKWFEIRAPCYHAWYMTIFLNRYATMWLMFHLLWTWKTLEHATQFLTWDNWDMLNMSKIKFVSKFKLQHFLENSFSIFKVNAFRNCYRVKFD